ncbi:ImmA/IrrE family metallo-endopeptidase [Enterovibrio norvegicus]|uniref:helix-turn-helix domain-containing protein n=1 Tax=Enterovibrio norvegicus TaxID=188144 RepID=UPI0010BF1B15|nr:XRE family transcriptional regulator [Enterovibrio norvegicus]TKF15882.1 ImmA/IrrE family metallo-endopeptidase [Enterovibrio norvegicus]
MIGERIKRARAAAGLSMQALGNQVGISANMVKKYEHDQSMPSSGVLLKLAAALSVRTEYFFRPAEVTLGEVEYRKKASASAKLIKKIESDVIDQAERWLALKNVWPNFPIANFDYRLERPKLESLDAVDQVANQVRKDWQLGINPLPDLIDLLESKGILVIVSNVPQANKFDGLQAKIAGQPIVVVSSHWPGCRQRFTLAHELGHLVLHDLLDESLDEEKACNRFASAFLLPDTGVYQHLGERRSNLDPKELYFLKHEYGMSMAACLYRSADLGVISEEKKRQLYIAFSKNGWRKKEPGSPYPQEQTQLFEQLVYRALAEGILSESKAAELLQMSVMSLHKQRQMLAEVL